LRSLNNVEGEGYNVLSVGWQLGLGLGVVRASGDVSSTPHHYFTNVAMYGIASNVKIASHAVSLAGKVSSSRMM
jgi:hypothetical protein